MSKWRQLDLWVDEDSRNMNEMNDGVTNIGEAVETDQFQVLEEKIDSLINLITELRKEKELLADKAKIQDEKIVDLTEEIDGLKATRDKAKQRIVTMLEKINQIDV